MCELLVLSHHSSGAAHVCVCAVVRARAVVCVCCCVRAVVCACYLVCSVVHVRCHACLLSCLLLLVCPQDGGGVALHKGKLTRYAMTTTRQDVDINRVTILRPRHNIEGVTDPSIPEFWGPLNQLLMAGQIAWHRNL